MRGLCGIVVSVGRAADLVVSVSALTCDTLSASPCDTWHPTVVTDSAELRGKGTDSLGRCPAQCRLCRHDSSALEEDLHQQMEMQKFWKPSSLPSEPMELQCAAHLTGVQKNTGIAGGYLCPTPEEKPPWSHSTEAGESSR